MTTLTGAQRRYLRSLAHHLDPICYVGKNGVSPHISQLVAATAFQDPILLIKADEWLFRYE